MQQISNGKLHEREKKNVLHGEMKEKTFARTIAHLKQTEQSEQINESKAIKKNLKARA